MLMIAFMYIHTCKPHALEHVMYSGIVCHVFRLAAWLGWLRGSAVERRSLAGKLSLSCARPVADG